MTANQLYRTTLAIMSENESNASSYTEFLIPNINLLLSELFDAENSLRATSGADILADIPEIMSMTDELPYQEQLCRTVMPYGLATYLALGDDEYTKRASTIQGTRRPKASIPEQTMLMSAIIMRMKNRG